MPAYSIPQKVDSKSGCRGASSFPATFVGTARIRRSASIASSPLGVRSVARNRGAVGSRPGSSGSNGSNLNTAIDRIAQPFRQCLDQRFVPILKSLQMLASREEIRPALLCVPSRLLKPRGSTLPEVCLRLVKNRKSRTQAELFRISRIDAGNKRTCKTIKQHRREFSPDKRRDGFVGFRGSAAAKNIAEQSRPCATRHQRRGQKSRPHGNMLQFAFDQNIAGRPGIGEQALTQQAKLSRYRGDRRVTAEALWPAFQQVAVALDRLNHATGTRG